MGMFDEIKVEYPLPNPEVQNHTFQTKAFDNAMEVYTITASGRLMLRKVEWEETPEEEMEYYGTPEWDTNPIVRVFGIMREKSAEMVDTQYHGDVYFGTYTGDWNAKTAVEYDYVARFTDGQLQWIKRVNA